MAAAQPAHDNNINNNTAAGQYIIFIKITVISLNNSSNNC